MNRYCEGMSQVQFFANELVVDAVLRNLELLGEAARQIPDDVRPRYPMVPWRRIAGLRDVLAHATFGLEEGTIWQAVSQKHPGTDSPARCRGRDGRNGPDLRRGLALAAPQ